MPAKKRKRGVKRFNAEMPKVNEPKAESRESGKLPAQEISRAEVRETAEQLRKAWGMKLTGNETTQIVNDAINQIEKSEGMGIKPAVRSQMFAKLIDKAPAKAINLRMKMREKQGRTVTDGQKTKIRAIAKTEGWRAANAALRAAIKENQTGGKRTFKTGEHAAVKTGGKGKRKRPQKGGEKKKGPETAGVSIPKKEGVVPEGVSKGKSALELLELVKQANVNIRATLEDYETDKAKLDKKYAPHLGGRNLSGMTVKNREKYVEEQMKTHPELTEYKKRLDTLEKKTLTAINNNKKNRDEFINRVLTYMYKNRTRSEIEAMLKDITNSRGQGAVAKINEYDNLDLSVGSAVGVGENVRYVDIAVGQLKLLLESTKVVKVRKLRLKAVKAGKKG